MWLQGSKLGWPGAKQVPTYYGISPAALLLSSNRQAYLLPGSKQVIISSTDSCDLQGTFKLAKESGKIIFSLEPG